MRIRLSLSVLTVILFLLVVFSPAQQVQVEEFVLDNGMKFLLVPRHGDPNVAAGWVAKVGSVNEHSGITGVSHLFEHMMFKGTHVIGTKDIEKDLEIIADLDRVKAEIRAEEENLLRRARLGEIQDPGDPAVRSLRHRELLEEFDRLIQLQRELLISNEFDRIYTQAGASGMNAGTSEDFTVYFINVPANKLELWFWMESDRLSHPVFREFYSEKDVVLEERRMSVESTPTGRFQEEFNSMFWTSHPYGWPVLGWPSDLQGLTRREAADYFDLNYAPNNVAACLVGDFDPGMARELARKYFGRLKRGPWDPDPVRTREVEQQAEKRMVAFAETNPEVEIRLHTVADGHVDEPALVVLGALLSGRTGRLYRKLVLEDQIANDVSAGQNGLKWAGYFQMGGVAKPGHRPEEVEEALYMEIEKLKKDLVGERELQKVKNRFAANNFRRIQSNFALMIQLLIAEAGRGWRSFNEDPSRIQAVTPEDIRRVVSTYFKPESRAVVLYYRKDASGAVERAPELVSLSAEDQAKLERIQQMLPMMSAKQIQMLMEQLETAGAEAPQDRQPMIQTVKRILRERLKELEGGK